MMTKINSRSPQVLLSVRDLIMPYFVVEGNRKKEPVKNMPGIARLSIDLLVKDLEREVHPRPPSTRTVT